jgi:hypothetical protein
LIPKELKVDIASEQAQIHHIEEKITARNTTISETRKRFDEDKKRYLLLKHQPSKETP